MIEEIRITKLIEFQQIDWDGVLRHVPEGNHLFKTRAPSIIERFRDALQLLPPYLFSVRVSKRPEMLIVSKALLELYSADTLILQRSILPGMTQRWEIKVQNQNSLHCRFQWNLKDKAVTAPWLVNALWGLLFFGSAVFTAALVGLTIYAASVLLLVAFEPRRALSVTLRDPAMWLSVLCVFAVWAGISGAAVRSIAATIKNYRSR